MADPSQQKLNLGSVNCSSMFHPQPVGTNHPPPPDATPNAPRASEGVWGIRTSVAVAREMPWGVVHGRSDRSQSEGSSSSDDVWRPRKDGSGCSGEDEICESKV